MEVDEFQSPYGEMGNTTRDNSFSRIMLDAGFSPLTGKWVIRHEQPNYHNPNYPCGFSPLTGKWVIRQKNNPFYGYRANVSFSPLTGKWVIRPLFFGLLFVLRVRGEFQSPYGEMGNTTLSLSTRSGSGPTGDFFKPRAFFAFFGDPGSKPKSDSVVFSLSYAIFSPF